jgi:hypothetical protein
VAGEAPWATDRTQQSPRTPADTTDRTQIVPADRTAMLPRDDGPDAGRAEAAARAAAGRASPNWENRSEPAWAGRAEVRQARPGAGGDFTRSDWAPVEPESGRAWWSPILIGIVVLLLVAALGVGIWLIMQSVSADEQTPPAVTPTKVAATTTRPSSAPTSAAPSTTPPTSAPAESTDVPIPALQGLSSADARQALDRVGLTYRLKFVASDAPSGTVIDSDPPEGREVPADSQVTLIIAAARSSAPATPTGAAQPDE